MDRLYKCKLAYAVSPHASGNSARLPMDQCNYERNPSRLSFYATTLPCVANILFQQNEVGAIFLNPAAFGELVVIVRHIKAEPVVVQFWSEIHPRIVNVSRELFVDGHCSAAAEKAIKEVESRLREKFSELKPGAAVPQRSAM